MASPLGTSSLPLSPPQRSMWNRQNQHDSSWESDLLEPHDVIETPTRNTQSSYDRRLRYHHHSMNEKRSSDAYGTSGHLQQNHEHRTSPSPRRHNRYSGHNSDNRRYHSESSIPNRSPNRHDVLRGAGIVRRDLEDDQRQSERSETRKILRGAEIIRSQIMSQYGSGREENLNGRMSSLTFSSSSVPVNDEEIVEFGAGRGLRSENDWHNRHFVSSAKPASEDTAVCRKQRHMAPEDAQSEYSRQPQRHGFHPDSPSRHIEELRTPPSQQRHRASPRRSPIRPQRMVHDHRSHHHSSSPCASSNSSYSSSSSPVSVDGFNKMRTRKMSKEEQAAYQHAQNAGLLWLTLVGAHLRFPSHWFNGARSPPMDDPHYSDCQYSTHWKYGTTEQHLAVASARTSRGSLGSYVKNRRSAGRVLLHIVVRDDETLCPIRDISVGCYHPNAKGVRKTDQPNIEVEDMRAVWIAVRKRQGGGSGGAFVDSLLTMRRDEYGEKRTYASPLGRKHSVSNSNVRAVFGDKAPVETLFLVESHLKKLMHREGDFRLPAMRMVAEFLF